MTSISSHLTKKIIVMVIIIYSFFLLTYLFIHYLDKYNDIKEELAKEKIYKTRVLHENIEYYYYYNNQIEEILSKKYTWITAFDDLNLNDAKINLMNVIFDNNQIFNNFYIVDKNGEIKYHNGEKNIKMDFLKQITYEGPILTKQLTEENNQLHVISMYDNSYYLIYSYHENVLEEIYGKEFKNIYFYVQTKHNDILITNYENEEPIQLISSDTDKGYTPLFKSKYISYYDKVFLFDKEYAFVSQIKTTDILFDNLYRTGVGLSLLIFVLSISFLLIKYRIAYTLKKPLKNLIFEIESFSARDSLYFTNAQEPSDYKELSAILTQFKKIYIHNKNTYENIIEDLKSKLQSAEESNISKSLFLANMSHEMRTPLNSIIGYTQLTQKIGFDNKNKVKEYFDCINNSSEILLQKVNDILDLSKIESKQFELNLRPTEIKKLIREIHHILKIQAEKKGINFTYDVDQHIPDFLEFDKTRLKQVLINLCSNAIKFTDHGFVNLEVKLFGITNDSVVLEYKISDSGCGIPKNKIDKIFIPFVQVENNKHIGTGLGLTIARDLIRLMGGDISVTSKENVGSIFSFNTIFLVSNQVESVTGTKNGFDNELFIRKISDKKILIAEDNVINQLFMKELFAVFNKNDVDIASDGVQVIKMCNEKNYDIILMDIQMPVMTGLDATIKIRAMDNYKHVPIIALTANAFSNQIQEYLDLGMNDFLPKPVDINRFKTVLINNI